jgi:hypothetical protein
VDVPSNNKLVAKPSKPNTPIFLTGYKGDLMNGIREGQGTQEF